MIAQGRLILTDELGRNHVALNPEGVDAVYHYNRGFWKTRQTFNPMPLPPEEAQKVIDAQVVTNTPYNEGERKKLREIYEQGDFSMLELGAANGTVFERLGAEDFHYLGFEMMPELVADCRPKHPNANIFVGDVADLIKWYIPRRYALFYAHVSFIMIKPDLVRAALEKAAGICDQFLIYDFVDYPSHDLEEDEYLILDMDRAEKWFIHDWDRYIPEVGFEIVDKQIGKSSGSAEFDNQLSGCGYIHAVKS